MKFQKVGGKCISIILKKKEKKVPLRKQKPAFQACSCAELPPGVSRPVLCKCDTWISPADYNGNAAVPASVMQTLAPGLRLSNHFRNKSLETGLIKCEHVLMCMSG